MVSPISSFWLFGSVALLCAGINLANGDDEQDTAPLRANAVIAEGQTGGAASPTTPGRIVRIAKESDGLFYVFAKVNGVRVRFLVDTGANLVVLTSQDARRVGADFVAERALKHVETAAGPSRMNRITLDRVSIAGRTLGDIDAAVMHDGLKVSLMGQNMLSQLGPITLSDGELLLQRSF